MTTKEQGVYVVARKHIGAHGHPVFTFGTTPYRHRTWNGAEQQARALTRQHEAAFGIFELVAETKFLDEQHDPNL